MTNEEKELSKRQKEEERRQYQEVQKQYTKKKSLWQRIKEMFQKIRDQISVLTLPKRTRKMLDMQMEISAKRNLDAELEKQKQERSEYPKRLYQRYLHPECERSDLPIQTRLQEMAQEILIKEIKDEIIFPNKYKMEVIPHKDDLRVSFHLYDYQNNPLNSNVIQFENSRTGLIINHNQSKITELINLLQKTDTFFTPENKQQEIMQNIETKKEEIVINQSIDYDKEYRQLVQKYTKNPFLLTLPELEKMPLYLVSGKLDINDEKKFSRTVVIKPFDKEQSDIKIKAVWNKEVNQAEIKYLRDDTEINRDEVQIALDNAKRVRYTIPEWIKENELNAEKQSLVPRFQVNCTSLTASLSQTVLAVRQDYASNQRDLPQEAILDIQNAIKSKNMEKMQEWYECLSFIPSAEVMAKFPRIEQVKGNMEEIAKEQNTCIQYPDITAQGICYHEYIDRLNSINLTSNEWHDFVKAENTHYASIMNNLQSEFKQELNSFLQYDIDQYTCALEQDEIPMASAVYLEEQEYGVSEPEIIGSQPSSFENNEYGAGYGFDEFYEPVAESYDNEYETVYNDDSYEYDEEMSFDEFLSIATQPDPNIPGSQRSDYEPNRDYDEYER